MNLGKGLRTAVFAAGVLGALALLVARCERFGPAHMTIRVTNRTHQALEGGRMTLWGSDKTLPLFNALGPGASIKHVFKLGDLTDYYFVCSRAGKEQPACSIGSPDDDGWFTVQVVVERDSMVVVRDYP